MAEDTKGVLIKPPIPVHAELTDTMTVNQNSMQKVVQALIEGWLSSSAGDPHMYASYAMQGMDVAAGASSSLGDEARSDLLKLNKLVNELREDVDDFMKWKDE